MADISIVGAGSFGLALAVTLNKAGHNVSVWSFKEEEKQAILQERENKARLPGILVPESIKITTDLKDISSSELTLISVPSTAVRPVAKKLKPHVAPNTIVANMSKGIEKDSLKNLYEAISEEIPNNEIAVIYGPSHAEELARNVPTSMVAACPNTETVKRVQKIMQNETIKIYISNDVKGLAICSTCKNVIAIAVGICAKLGAGDNLIAVLLTKGLCEIGKLGTAMGAKPQTFVGLAGLGDLLATCLSKHSRNRRFGELLTEGTPVNEVLKKINMVVEGYDNLAAVNELTKKYKLRLPIINTLYKVVYEGEDTKKIMGALKCDSTFEDFWF